MSSKSAKQLRRQQRQRRRQTKAQKRKPSARRPAANSTWLPTLKMSEVISHLAEPLVEEHAETHEDTRRIISLTIAAWNLTLLPEERRENERDVLARKMFGRSFCGVPLRPDQESVDWFAQVCDLVADRKRKFYPNLHHFILDVRFEPRGDDVYFEVMYSPDLSL